MTTLNRANNNRPRMSDPSQITAECAEANPSSNRIKMAKETLECLNGQFCVFSGQDDFNLCPISWEI